MRSASSVLRQPFRASDRAAISDTSADAVSDASPSTPRSTFRWTPIARGSRSTWMTTACGPMSLPWAVVHAFKEAPKASTRSAWAISSDASGEAKPPEMPRFHCEREKSPLATAEVASSAPTASPTRSSASPAPASTAPRPARISGRSAPARRSATSATAEAAGRGGVAGQYQQGSAALGCFCEASDGVGQSRALVDATNTEPTAYPRVRVGHCDRAALVSGRNERRPRGHQGVGDHEVAAPDQTEDIAYAKAREHRADGLGYRRQRGASRRVWTRTRLTPGCAA